MNTLGDDLSFANATNAWRQVAADLASKVASTSKNEFPLFMGILRLAGETVSGAFWDFMIDWPKTLDDGIIKIGKAALPPLSSLGGDLVTWLRGADLQRQQFSQDLEKAVEYSCVRHPTVEGEQRHQS